MNATANNITRHRTAHGWTIAELARRAGLKRETVSNYETGKRNPTYKPLFSLSRALGVSVSDLCPDFPAAPATASAHTVCDYCASVSPLLKELCRR